MKRIIAIGGGEIKDNETILIDQRVVFAANKKNPKLLFIPTASGEPQGYVNSIQKVYGEQLGCEVKALLLLEGSTSVDEARKMILKSDIIYVGGGNTKRMLEVWKEYSIDEALKEAYARGIVLSGLSAGSICWFNSGHSDSITYETGVKSPYIQIKGLGLIKGLHCPHYNEEDRAEEFEKMVAQTDEIGIAIENNCAIDFCEDEYKIIKSDESAKAFKIYRQGEEIIYRELTNTCEYKKVSELFSVE